MMYCPFTQKSIGTSKVIEYCVFNFYIRFAQVCLGSKCKLLQVSSDQLVQFHALIHLSRT